MRARVGVACSGTLMSLWVLAARSTYTEQNPLAGTIVVEESFCFPDSCTTADKQTFANSFGGSVVISCPLSTGTIIGTFACERWVVWSHAHARRRTQASWSLSSSSSPSSASAAAAAAGSGLPPSVRARAIVLSVARTRAPTRVHTHAHAHAHKNAHASCLAFFQ